MEAATFNADSLAFGEVRADGGKVSVPFGPLALVTGVAELVTAPVDDDGSVAPFIKLAFASPEDARAFEAFEDAVLAAAKAERAAWFGKGLTSDHHIDTSFKRFAEGGVLKARLSTKTIAFDHAGDATDIAAFHKGTRAKALLEAGVVRIGKSEFGSVWSVAQLREVRRPECLILDEPERIEDDEDAWIV